MTAPNTVDPPAAATGISHQRNYIVWHMLGNVYCTRISQIDGLSPSRRTFWAYRRHRGTRVAAPGVERAE